VTDDENQRRAQRLRKCGLSWEAVAARLGVSAETARKYCGIVRVRRASSVPTAEPPDLRRRDTHRCAVNRNVPVDGIANKLGRSPEEILEAMEDGDEQ
jgi:hypothetical protein